MIDFITVFLKEGKDMREKMVREALKGIEAIKKQLREEIEIKQKELKK